MGALDAWLAAGGGASRSSRTWNRYASGSRRKSPFEQGSPDDVLARARVAYGNKQGEAQALGLEETGEAAPGLLTRASRALDYPRAFLFSAGHELADLVGGGGDASFRDFREQLDRRAGFGDTQALQTDEDDSILERGAKGVAAFLGDVVTDPLTYVTFGGAAVGKRAGAEVVESVGRGLAKDLPENVVERFAKRSTPERAVEVIRRTHGGKAAERFAKDALAKPRIVTDEAAWKRLIGQQEFAGALAEQYVQGGATGLKAWLKRELPKQGEELFKRLPRDVQGGLNIRAPFARKTLEGGVKTPFTRGIGGGDLLAKVLGEEGAESFVRSAQRVRNRIRTSKVVSEVAAKLGGAADSRLYGEVIGGLLRSSGDLLDDLPNATFSQYAAVRRARVDAGRLGKNLHKDTADTVGTMSRFVNLAPDQEVARRTMTEWFNDPQRITELRRSGYTADPISGEVTASGLTGPDPLEALDESQRAGVASALLAHDYLEQIHERLLASGVNIGRLDEYVPLILNEEARLARQAKKPVRPSARRGGGVGGHDPTKQARQFWVPQLTEEGGKARITGWRRLSPFEVNTRQASGALDEPPVPKGHVRLYRGSYGRQVAVDLPEQVAARRGRYFTSDREKALAYARQGGGEPRLKYVDVPADDVEDFRDAIRAFTDPQGGRDEFVVSADVAQRAKDLAKGGEFVEDPLRILYEYGNAARRLAVRVNFSNLLHESGAIVKGTTEGLPQTVAVALRDLERFTDESVRAWQRTLGGQARRAVATRDDAEGGLVRAVDRVLEDLPDAVRQQVRQRLSAAARRGQIEIPSGQERIKRVLAEADWQQVGRREDGTTVWRPSAAAALAAVDATAPLRDAAESILEDRDRLSRAIADLMDAPRAKQLKNVEGVVEGFLDLHARAVAGLGEEAARRGGDEAVETLEEARKAFVKAQRAAGETVESRSVLTPEAAFLEEAGLTQVGTRKTGQAVTEGAVLPPELNVSFAPEILRTTVEKFYRASRPESKELAAFIDGVYAPYIRMFKTTATIGRGYGYDARNVGTGLWNNYLIDAGRQEHALAAKRVRIIRRLRKEVAREEAAKAARRLGITDKEALDRLDQGYLDRILDQRLQREMDDIEVAPGVSMYDAHIAYENQQVGFGASYLQEGLGEAVESGDIARFTQGRGGINLFPGRTPDDLNRGQRGFNRIVDNPWVRHKARVAEMSEEFIRFAAFAKGVRNYGLDDGGRSAGLVAKALHFDYDDLTDFEKTWMRGFAIPFYTYTRKAVPLQFRALIREPGRVQRILHANDALRDVFGADDEADVVPEWMAEKLGWVSRFKVGDDPIVVGLESPLVDLNRFIRTGRPGESGRAVTREVLNMLTPPAKGVVEAATQTNLFTGAPFNPEGVPAPAWAQALRPLGLTRTDDQGRARAPESVVQGVQNLLPFLGQAERLSGAAPQYRERLLTTWLSQMAAAPVSTLSERQQAGELRSRLARLERRIDWSKVDPERREFVKWLLDQDVPPEVVASIAAD